MSDDQVLVPLRLREIREIIHALRENFTCRASLKTELLSKLHYHEEWFQTLKHFTKHK
jgi:hypothetical protein